MEKQKAQTVDDYISIYPENIQRRLRDIRKIVKKVAPDAIEKISYGMPAYLYKGMLIYYAVHTHHIGMYPYPSTLEAFRSELAGYRTSKGTVQFPHDKPIPTDLIADIVKFRVQENIFREEFKKTKKRVQK